jgi:hypothetical protein
VKNRAAKGHLVSHVYNDKASVYTRHPVSQP